jgi:DNA-binding NarL/FixJ family response regulator
MENFPLPKKLRVAIIREEEEGAEEIITAFRRLKEEEQFSEWQFDTYNNASEFLHTPGCLTYDLVITDIVMGEGGGLYLARKLRYHKFSGGILALTGFYQKTETGITMKADGIDGAIYTGHLKYEQDITSFFAQKLRNYLYYRYLSEKELFSNPAD